jgi:hypothetical protein
MIIEKRRHITQATGQASKRMGKNFQFLFSSYVRNREPISLQLCELYENYLRQSVAILSRPDPSFPRIFNMKANKVGNSRSWVTGLIWGNGGGKSEKARVYRLRMRHLACTTRRIIVSCWLSSCCHSHWEIFRFPWGWVVGCG